MELAGLLSYGVFFLTMVGIYAIMTLGLNVQWGYTGMFNIGTAAFFSVGAYATALATTAPEAGHLGGFDLPLVAGLGLSMVLAAVLAVLVGVMTLNLRTDYLAIASIGIAEIVRLVLKNEGWLTNGVRGIANIPRPFEGMPETLRNVMFLLFVLALLAVVWWAIHRAYRAPWGRVLRAIRENEDAARAMGKNVLRFRLEAFVLGSAVMGLAGALYAHFTAFISPEAFDPMFATFVVWVMLIAGGSGNNGGAVLGALLIWGVWSGTELLTGLLPHDLVTRGAALRVFLIGLLLEIILVTRPQGVLPERPPRPVADDER